MNVIQMHGFLTGKCIPGDMRVNETDAEYLVRKFAEKDEQVRQLTEQRDAVAAASVGMDKFVDTMLDIAWKGGSADGFDIQDAAIVNGLIREEVYCADEHETLVEDPDNFEDGDTVYFRVETPATEAATAALRAEGAHFVANRMLAAWEAGFIDDTAKNAADIARMILTSTEFMAEAPAGDFDRSFADGVLDDIARQLRESKGAQG